MLDDMMKNLGNLGNLGELMSKARDMQEQMKKMQDELAKKMVTADAGGGMVQATVNGKLELVKLKIDKTKIDVNDIELLEDVIVAAVHGAQAKASDMMQQDLRRQAQEMGVPPGMLE
ncbi:MAG TPA: YbaB/EbfC family nucleoid-associated protein [Tepidisphaeraceae bacterium]|jgi:DNA-binding YbaB/EbfC family protein